MIGRASKLAASVIIPSFNRADALSRCLPLLTHQINEHPLPSEIIVVDDGSLSAHASRLRDLVSELNNPAIRLLAHDHNCGLCAARNSGVAHARGSILIFMDDDLVPSPTFIADHVAIHAEHPKINFLCGHLFTQNQSVYGRFWQHCYHYVFGQPADGRNLYTVPMLSGGNLSIKRAALDSFSPLFDESLPSREDFDLWLRIRAEGQAVYKAACAAAEVVPRTTFLAFYRQWKWYREGEAHLRAKHGDASIDAATAPLRVPLTMEMRLLSLATRGYAKLESWRARKVTRHA